MVERDAMEYTELGSTGERVSRLGFGGAPAGLANYLGEYDPDEAAARERVRTAVRTAFERGVTYFDTAPGYGDGTSEELLGEALAEFDREDLFVATKVELGDADYVRDRVAGSVERLGVNHIDLLQIHGGSYDAADVERVLDGGTLAGMERLREAGRVDYLGFTTEDHNPAVFDFLDEGVFDVMQINYNLMFQHPYNPINGSGALVAADERGVGTVTMRTTTSGILQEWVETVAPDAGVDYRPALVQFVLSNPLVDVALVGMRNPEVVEANADLVADTDGRIDIEALFERYA
jgi:aryl-alcohol dehydrogenase-like predicted oxidoreductase